MKEKFDDISGQVHNRLKVIRKTSVDCYGNAIWECLCSCGNTTHVPKYKITRGHVKSCGCLKEERRLSATVTHGNSRGAKCTREYRTWNCMKMRCISTDSEKRKYYLDRGISVCKEWVNSFENFLGDMGKCPDGFTIDRIDNEAGYSKNNCRWASKETQENNKRGNVFLEYGGNRLTVAQWARKVGVTRHQIYSRIKYGWSTSKILTSPVKVYQSRK